MELPIHLRDRFDIIFTSPTYSAIRELEGMDFTWFIYYLFERDQLYRPVFTDGSKDGKVDIELRSLDPMSPDLLGVIQCKSRQKEKVSQDDMDLFVTNSYKYRVGRRYYFTTVDYTTPAKTLGRQNGVFLYTSDLIRSMILDIQRRESNKHLQPQSIQRLPIPVICITNFKGGAGKTTLTANLAAALAQNEQRVLVIDTDPSAQITNWLLGRDPQRKSTRSLYRVLKDHVPIHPCIMPAVTITDVFVLPSHIDLVNLHEHVGWDAERYLAYALMQLPLLEPRLDFILIDTPSNLYSLTRAAIIAAQYLVFPFKLDGPSYDGVYPLLDFVQEIGDLHSVNPQILGGVIMEYERTKVEDELKALIPPSVIKHQLFQNSTLPNENFWIGQTRKREDFPRAYRNRTSIFDRSYDRQAKTDMLTIAKEVQRRATTFITTIS